MGTSHALRWPGIGAVLLAGCASQAEAVHRPLPPLHELAAAVPHAQVGTTYHYATSYCVEPDGSTSQIVTERSTGDARLDAVYLRTIASWRFRPARVRGKAVGECRTGRFTYNHRPDLFAAGSSPAALAGAASAASPAQAVPAGSGAPRSGERLELDEIQAGLSAPKAGARRRCAPLAPNGGKAYVRMEIAGATGRIVDAYPMQANTDAALARCVIDIVRAEVRFRTFARERQVVDFSVAF